MQVTMPDGVIGRLLQNRTSVQEYGQVGRSAKSKADKPAGPAENTSDIVQFSKHVPVPVPAEVFEIGVEVGEAMRHGELPDMKTIDRLREDRVMTAVAALSLYDTEQGADLLKWPGGLPSPTGAELEAAHKRLSQRLQRQEAVVAEDDAMALREKRVDLLDRYRTADFQAIADTLYQMPRGLGPNR